MRLRSESNGLDARAALRGLDAAAKMPRSAAAAQDRELGRVADAAARRRPPSSASQHAAAASSTRAAWSVAPKLAHRHRRRSSASRSCRCRSRSRSPASRPPAACGPGRGAPPSAARRWRARSSRSPAAPRGPPRPRARPPTRTPSNGRTPRTRPAAATTATMPRHRISSDPADAARAAPAAASRALGRREQLRDLPELGAHSGRDAPRRCPVPVATEVPMNTRIVRSASGGVAGGGSARFSTGVLSPVSAASFVESACASRSCASAATTSPASSSRSRRERPRPPRCTPGGRREARARAAPSSSAARTSRARPGTPERSRPAR